jgi:hypothetical protein
MFIDRQLCLCSYNVFGEGDGSQLPQLHLAKAALSARDTTTLYYPFDLYFSWLWNLSESWDFHSFINLDDQA